MYKVCHLTSAHTRYDTRIFLKECCSLVSFGFEVSLVVADEFPDETVCGVEIYSVGKLYGRLNRIFKSTGRVFAKALAVSADIYHLHDPELIPVGLRLKMLGKVVIFDSHEDVAKQMMGKPYLNKALLYVIAKFYAVFESFACRWFDAIVAATPFIFNKFKLINLNSIVLNNFPLLGELSFNHSQPDRERNNVCYVGAIASIRGVNEIVKAMEYVMPPVCLFLAGKFDDLATRERAVSSSGWIRVNECGVVNRDGVRDILSHSFAGLVTFHDLPNHVDAQPNKMFEYMSAGVPVIASNFPLWRDIVEGNDCGLCVDPVSPLQISEAINFLYANPVRARQMGENGKNAVINKYNWDAEKIKLRDLYMSF